MNHYPNALPSLRARLDHRSHRDQPRCCDQNSNRDYEIELNPSQELHFEHDIDDVPTFQVFSKRPYYDLFDATSSHISIQPSDPNLDLTQRRSDKNAIADHPSHRHQLRARSSNTR